MANAMLDARHEGDSYRRTEVITGERRRRRWTAEEKARIVAESFEEGANISEVARRNGVARGLVTPRRCSEGFRLSACRSESPTLPRKRRGRGPAAASGNSSFLFQSPIHSHALRGTRQSPPSSSQGRKAFLFATPAALKFTLWR